MIKKCGLVISRLGILSFLFTIIYMSSCTQPLDERPWKCNYVYCQNGGKCDSAKCKCPVGYEGKDCGTATVDKYLSAKWRMSTVIVGSDSAHLIGPGSKKTYPVQLTATATNTTFFMANFDGNSLYDHIICRIDSVDNNTFMFDTTSVLNMYYDHFRIRHGWGVMYTPDSIAGKLFIRHLNASINWQFDTLDYYIVKE